MKSVLVLATLVGLFALVCCQSTPASALEQKLPIMLAGGAMSEEGVLTREVVLPTPGVWYLWLKASNSAWRPGILTWDLDEQQSLKSNRSRVLINPYLNSQWISNTSYSAGSGFRIEVYVKAPGKHALNLRLNSGSIQIDKIALTLCFNAKPTADGETLDHSADPGGGRAEFPVSPTQVDGFREDWQSPAVEARGATYYLDSSAGTDENDGRSPERAWRTVAPVNSRTFEPGDAILLKRGGRWHGGFAPKGSGAADKWITIGAYGDGSRPYIDGANHPAVKLADQSYWVIQDLEATNSGDPEALSAIEVVSVEGKPQPKGIRIYNCIALDSGGHGIHVGCTGQSNGYDGVVIENCLAFANLGSGIEVSGLDQNGCRNTVIRYCTAFSNPGMAGIWIHSGQNGLIEHCVGYNNACINIWTWNSINITIRYCEAYRGRQQRDAGGFDIDWGCEACTLEYCYSHQNEGIGILLMGDGEDVYRNFPKQSRYNICRYNISENYMGIMGTFQNGKVYNNIILSGTSSSVLALVGWPLGSGESGKWSGGFPSNTEFLNNIAVSTGPGMPVEVSDDSARQNNTLDYNLYWRAGSAGLFTKWAGHTDPASFWEGKSGEANTPPVECATFDDFRRVSGMESHGIYADPRPKELGKGEIGRLPLEGYHLISGSPAVGAGHRIELSDEWLAERRKCLTDTGAGVYGIPMEPQPTHNDYWGAEIGASEVIRCRTEIDSR